MSFLALLAIAASALRAQPDRIVAPIEGNQSVVLSGRMHRSAAARNGAGPLAGDFAIPAMSLLFKPSAAQQADLDRLLLEQQSPASPNYRKWLTPEQYASRFGIGTGDLAKIMTWLESQGLKVGYSARGRNFVAFSGTAQQVASAFHTEIHRYSVNGETRYANTTAPSIPAALAGVVSAIRGLDNSRLKPLSRRAKPEMSLNGTTMLGPADFATIYDLSNLYSEGITGAGQSIAVLGTSNIDPTDIGKFRAQFGLSPVVTSGSGANLVLAEVSNNLGAINNFFVPGEESEADLAIEWAGAVAPQATVVYVASASLEDAAYWAVDNALAPVVSMSYTACEFGPDSVVSDQMFSWQPVAQEANVLGITLLAAAGDYGAADCDAGDYLDQAPVVALQGFAVDSPASVPEITAVGGTEFNEGSGNYWTNGAATGYIPEMAWNDTASAGYLLAGGGGASGYFTQPPWQNGLAPNDGMRHLPDLSFAASPVHDPMAVYSSDSSFSTVGWQGMGGTSGATSAMAGVMALLNQYVGSGGLGNINPALYSLAQAQSSAWLSQSAGSPFHDIVTGSNSFPCASGSPNCVNGMLSGWNAAQGYDSATGLGSVDAYNLVHQWSTAPATQPVVVASFLGNPVVYEWGSSWGVQITLTEEAGIAATLSKFSVNGTDESSQIPGLFGSGAIPALGSISAWYYLQNLDVSTGPVNVPFTFSGTAANGGAWSVTSAASFTGPESEVALAGANTTFYPATCRSMASAADGQRQFAPGQIVSIYGTGLAEYAQAANVNPLPTILGGSYLWTIDMTHLANDEYLAPLSYVSPNQVNVQIPYEMESSVGTDNGAALEVTDYITESSADCFFTVSSAAPGIMQIGSGSAKVGDTVAVYVNGAGAVTPSVADGATPAAGTVPVPVQPVSITVGGVAVAQPFAFIGIPSWSVGVLQIDFTVPTGVAVGQQPVVVTVGSAASLPADITITQ